MTVLPFALAGVLGRPGMRFRAGVGNSRRPCRPFPHVESDFGEWSQASPRQVHRRRRTVRPPPPPLGSGHNVGAMLDFSIDEGFEAFRVTVPMLAGFELRFGVLLDQPRESHGQFTVHLGLILQADLLELPHLLGKPECLSAEQTIFSRRWQSSTRDPASRTWRYPRAGFARARWPEACTLSKNHRRAQGNTSAQSKEARSRRARRTDEGRSPGTFPAREPRAPDPSPPRTDRVRIRIPARCHPDQRSLHARDRRSASEAASVGVNLPEGNAALPVSGDETDGNAHQSEADRAGPELLRGAFCVGLRLPPRVGRRFVADLGSPGSWHGGFSLQWPDRLHTAPQDVGKVPGWRFRFTAFLVGGFLPWLLASTSLRTCSW